MTPYFCFHCVCVYPCTRTRLDFVLFLFFIFYFLGLINGAAIDDFSDEIYEYAYDLLTEYEQQNGKSTNLFIAGHSLGML